MNYKQNYTMVKHKLHQLLVFIQHNGLQILALYNVVPEIFRKIGQADGNVQVVIIFLPRL